MEESFTGRTAVITGGSKGIGLAVATALAERGASVVVGARTVTDELAALRDRYGVVTVPTDLSTAEGPATLVSTAVETYGGVDVLVNNVGASEPAPSVIDFTDEAWQRVFDITLFSAVRATRAAVPAMKGRDNASIVTISSLNAKLPAGFIAPYSAAKAALTNYAKAVSEEYASQGIRANVVSPGVVRTPLWTAPGGFAEIIGAQSGVSPDEVMDRVMPETMAVATGRVSEPEEVAELVVFLASDRARNITGADFVIDGGTLKSV